MGFILANGVQADLRSVATPGLSDAELRIMAEKIAAGSAVPVRGLSADAVHAALTQGFG